MVDKDHTEPAASVSEAIDAAEVMEETFTELVQRLVALPRIEYERCRKAEAKRLKIRASVLDKEVASARPKDGGTDDLGLSDPEPWPERVDGDDLLDRVMGALCRHVVMPAHVAEAVTLWAAHCHCFKNWQHTPRLAITAPEKGCGKSTLLDVISCLVPRALQTDSLSEAVAFRLAESHRPTFLIDECDTHLASRNPDDGLRGILNSGHSKGRQALRCVGDDHTVKGFSTFTPVGLAGIGRLPETLADRSIVVVLQKRKSDEYIEDFRRDRADHLHELVSQIARWTADHQTELQAADPAMPETIHNRRADNWRPLFSIADAAGGEWPVRARQAATALSRDAGQDTRSIREQLLSDIRQIFLEDGGDRLPSKTIAERLHQIEDRPWPEYGKRSQPISVGQVARLLKPFAITSGTIRWGADTPKGYKLASFKEAFSRYVSPTPPFQNATTPQANVTAGLSPIPKRHNEADVAFRNSPDANVTAGCGVVAAGNGGVGDETLFSGIDDDPEERAAIQEFDGGIDPSD